MTFLKNCGSREDKQGRRGSRAKSAWIFVALALMAVVAISGCVGEEKTKQSLDESKMKQPLDVSLNLSGNPILDREVELSFTVTPWIDAPNTTMQVILPDGFTLLSGDLQWQGGILKNDSKTIKSTIKAVKAGDWKIKAWANIQLRDGSFGKADILYINTSETSANVRKES